MVLNRVSGNPGDFNDDGTVNAADYTVWRNAVGTNVAVGKAGDGNFDGKVTQADFYIWKANIGQSTNGLGVSVPEPGGVFLWLVAIVTLGARRRR